MGSILVVDDERSMREFLAIFLKREGHDVSIAESGQQALATLDGQHFDLIVTDIRMPGEIDGIGLLTAVRDRKLDTEVIVMTAFASAETAIQAMKVGAYDYLTKPFKVDDINAVIGRALEKRALIQANTALREKVTGRYRLASLIGRSPRMQRLFDLIGKVHSTRTNILITGESGVGKELVARAIHSEGNRSNAAFIAVNCGAIPEELMESELFGHVRGAFTGAVDDKPGLFRKADKGILFLDEIGELSQNLQVKLLRALQERRIRPVGASDEISVDVRVVAATNRELEAEVERGAFRSDLYYRLNVIELRIPPLRQRREDIPLLLEHFLRRYCGEHRRKRLSLSPAVARQLEAYDYPGNIRELENIIERAVTLAAGPTILPEDLPSFRTTPALAAVTEPIREIEFPADGIDLDRVLADMEGDLVRRALEQSGGVRKKAAGLLGISFRSLRYRLTKLGLEPEREPSDPKIGDT